MTNVSREAFNRYIGEALEALSEAKEIVYGKSVDEFLGNRRDRFALRYAIVLIVEALADLAIAILEKDFNVVPSGYREAFLLLAEKGVVGAELAGWMERMSALRNIIVHRYWVVDDARIYREAREGGLEAVEAFIREVERYGEVKDP